MKSRDQYLGFEISTMCFEAVNLNKNFDICKSVSRYERIMIQN